MWRVTPRELLASSDAAPATPVGDIVVIVVLGVMMVLALALVGRARRGHRPFGGNFGGTSGMGNSRFSEKTSAGRGGRFGGGGASGRW